MEELVSILGGRQCAVISQDDKASVPIGITAANKQAPMLMHMQYRVRLPDHDFVVAPRHKLIPSVYVGIHIKEGKIGDPKCVGYSGPTYVAVRSGKHCSSTAHTHAFDFARLMELEHFREIMYGTFTRRIRFVLFAVTVHVPITSFSILQWMEKSNQSWLSLVMVDPMKTHGITKLFLMPWSIS